MTGRRVAIAYTSFAVGRGLLQYARDKVLSPNDEIYIVHSFPDKNPVRPRLPASLRGPAPGVEARAAAVCPAALFGLVAQPVGWPLRLAGEAQPADGSPPARPQVVHQTMKLVRAMTLQRGDTMGEVTRDNSIDFGADLLAAFPKVHLNVVLQVWSGQGGRCRARRRWRREGCSVLFLGGGGGGVGSGRVAGA
jgi:hypothetical protein